MWRRLAPFSAAVPQEAARRWDADARVVAELGAWENFVYLVVSGHSRWVLRLVDAARQPVPAVAAELELVVHLGHAGLPVARAITSSHGHQVERVPTSAGEVFLATVFEYATGQSLCAEQCRAAPASFWRGWGSALGHLHAACAAFTPVNRARPRWDVDPLVRGGDAILARGPASIRRQFAETLAWLATLGEDAGSFGLVHADFHGRNFRYDRGLFRTFDFDDACYGWWAYDLAVGLAWAYGTTSSRDAAAALDAMLSGYYAVRAVNQDWVSTVPAFMRLRRILDYAHGLDRLGRGGLRPEDQTGYRAHVGALQSELEATAQRADLGRLTRLWRW